MNTLVAFTSTAVDLRVSDKALSGCASGHAGLFVSSATPGSGHSRLLARHNYSAPTFGTSSILLLKAATTATNSPEYLLRWCSSPSLTVLFPCA
jgi:hypothetical protein